MSSRPYLLLLLLYGAVLYGVSYQQFRHFNPATPHGLTDTQAYMELAQVGSTSRPEFRSRVLVPALARLTSNALSPLIEDDTQRILLSFYVVNYLLLLGAALVLHAYLRTLGSTMQLALIGSLLFLTSRVVSYCAAVPLIDSIYFLGLFTLLLLEQTGRKMQFYLVSPILLLGKEALFPFCLLPLLRKERTGKDFLGVTCCILAFFLLRWAWGGPPSDLPEQIQHYMALVPSNISQLFTFSGLHQLLHGYSLLIIPALLYVVLAKRIQISAPNFPKHSPLILFVSIIFVILVPNSGRVALTAFPVIVIAVLRLVSVASDSEHS